MVESYLQNSLALNEPLKPMYQPAQNILQRIAGSVMITCNECIDRMKPDDPRVKSGKYHLCGCDYCNKPTYYRDLETIKSEIQPVFRPRPVDKDIDQLKAGFIHLQNKLNEYIDKNKNGKNKADII